MKILVNVFHPNLELSKVNHRWVKELASCSDLTVNLIYERYPDWKIDVRREQEYFLQHDRIVFQHPFFWYSTPPLMKKWLDEVLTYAWAYGPGGNALHGKEWVAAITTGGPGESYQAGGYNNYSMSELIKPLQQTANLIGMKFLPPFIFHGAVQATPELINESAIQYAKHICNPELDPQITLRRLLSEMEKAGTKLET
jgi:putative NADPH-quinone reductase